MELSTTAQSTLLLAKMRDYLAYRLGPKRAVFSKAAEATEDAGEPAADAEEAIAEGQEGHAEVNDTDVVNSEPPPKPVVPETVNGPEDMGMPVPDGQGGVLLPAADEPEEPVEERLSFPDAPAEANGGPEGTSISVPREANAEAGPSTVNETGLSREEQPVYIDVLPEIGKLSREIVRNAEEKLAIAVGAYNTVRRPSGELATRLTNPDRQTYPGPRLRFVQPGGIHPAWSPPGHCPFRSRRYIAKPPRRSSCHRSRRKWRNDSRAWWRRGTQAGQEVEEEGGGGARNCRAGSGHHNPGRH